jgi:hypothetical protein
VNTVVTRTPGVEVDRRTVNQGAISHASVAVVVEELVIAVTKAVTKTGPNNAQQVGRRETS